MQQCFWTEVKMCTLSFCLISIPQGEGNFTRLSFVLICMAPLKYTCVESYMGDYYLSWNFPYCFSNLSLIKFTGGIFYSISIYQVILNRCPIKYYLYELCKIPFIMEVRIVILLMHSFKIFSAPLFTCYIHLGD